MKWKNPFAYSFSYIQQILFPTFIFILYMKFTSLLDKLVVGCISIAHQFSSALFK